MWSHPFPSVLPEEKHTDSIWISFYSFSLCLFLNFFYFTYQKLLWSTYISMTVVMIICLYGNIKWRWVHLHVHNNLVMANNQSKMLVWVGTYMAIPPQINDCFGATERCLMNYVRYFHKCQDFSPAVNITLDLSVMFMFPLCEYWKNYKPLTSV